MTLPPFIDDVRRAQGLMTMDALAALVDRGNIVFDPFSVLIAAAARIGSGNVFFPCVSLLCRDEGGLEIGDNNRFFSQTLIEAVSGPIRIGSGNQFGEGGFTAKTNRPGAAITIGDHGRYLNGAAVFGVSHLGSGSQILGAITVDGCTLAPGGSHEHPDPDHRAGLLKGAGAARDLMVPMGQVIAAQGIFSSADLKPQSLFHPNTR